MRFGKYGISSKSARTWKGITYHSKAEMLRAKDLEILVLCKEVESYERQVKFKLGSDHKYTADFVVTMPGGVKHVEEVKGAETARFKTTRRLWKKYGPMSMTIWKRNWGKWTTEVLEGAQNE